MTEGSAKQITSTSAAAVSVADASYVLCTEGLRPAGTLRIREDTENSVADAAYARSAEGLQSAEEANSYHVSQQAYARSAEGLQSIQCVIL